MVVEGDGFDVVDVCEDWGEDGVGRCVFVVCDDDYVFGMEGWCRGDGWEGKGFKCVDGYVDKRVVGEVVIFWVDNWVEEFLEGGLLSVIGC